VTLGQKIRAARLEQRLTQEQLGGRDYTKSYVSEIERDHRTPRLTTLKILARRLNRPLSYFLDGVTEDREPEAFMAVGLAALHAGALDDAAGWLGRAQEAATGDGDELLQARIDLALAQLDRRRGHDLRAWRRSERALRALAHEGGPALIRAHLCLGGAKLGAGDPASAEWNFEAALRLLRDPSDDPAAAASLHYSLGVARQCMGQPLEAEEAFRHGLDLAQRFAGGREAAACSIARAAAAAREGAFEEAILHAGEAIAVLETVQHRRRLADIHWRLGDLDAQANRWTEASRHYTASVAIWGAAQYVDGAAHALSCLVDAMQARSSPEVVRTLGETALALFPVDEAVERAPHERAATFWLRGTAQRLLGHLDEARTSLNQGLGIFQRLGRADEAKAICRELAVLAVEAEDLATAREYLQVLRESPERYRVPAGP
jgi:transcriptional regulator with XRE-family HTH domain